MNQAPALIKPVRSHQPSDGRSYDQILKSTALIGASSAINVGFSILRLKAFALLLGPNGVGLIGLYSSLLEVSQALAGLGVQTSGVRQIAEAEASGDQKRITQTIIALRRVSLLLAMVGALGFAFAAPFLSPTMSGEGAQATVAILAAALALRIIAGSQGALIQGKRRIADLAKLNTIGAGVSTLAAIPLVYWWGLGGIAPSILVMAAASLATSSWYSRKVELPALSVSWADFGREAQALLRLGMIFMVSAVLTLASAYVIRLIVLQGEGLIAAGLYQAAWTIGGLYASFILQAMGADFYPRLTAICHDNDACNRLVNEQVQVSILLAGPGVLATLTLAPLVLGVLYSSEFVPAVELLRWICVGMLLRIVAWPLGYIIVARAANKAFFWTEVAATLVHVGVAWILVPRLGLVGAGLAFFGLYLWHSGLVYLLVRSMSGFRFSSVNIWLIALFTGASGLLLGAFATLPPVYSGCLGIVSTLACSAFALRMLSALLSADMLPARLRWLIRKTIVS
jgi:PST family polysaccharide transporter